jgi:hypothetical protein
MKYSNCRQLFHAISIPSKATRSSPCLQGHLSPLVQLDTASAGQAHQSYIFCNKHHLANTIKSDNILSTNDSICSELEMDRTYSRNIFFPLQHTKLYGIRGSHNGVADSCPLGCDTVTFGGRGRFFKVSKDHSAFTPPGNLPPSQHHIPEYLSVWITQSPKNLYTLCVYVNLIYVQSLCNRV